MCETISKKLDFQALKQKTLQIRNTHFPKKTSTQKFQ